MSTSSLALITGASMGLGRAFAEECAERGYRLLLVALPGGGLIEIAQYLARRHGVKVEPWELDLTVVENRQLLERRINEEPAGLSLLINNAGAGARGRFDELAPHAYAGLIGINCEVVVDMTQRMLPALRRAGRSTIINVASMGAFLPMPMMAT